MPIVWEKFSGTEEEVEKVKYAGMEEFIIVKNTDVSQAPVWPKDHSYFLPGFFQDSIETIYDFEVRPDDVWLLAFPKTGSTWTQEMIWQICNDLDYERSEKKYETETFTYLETNYILSKQVKLPNILNMLRESKSRRFIRSHLAAPLLPKQLWTVKPKMIYVARNVKDVAISFYHYYRNVHHFSGSWEDFFDIFMKDRVMFAPYHTHVSNFWHIRNEDNILFLTYEEMKRDHPNVIRKTAQFLGKSLKKEEVLELADYLSFSRFSKNSRINFEKHVDKFQRDLQTTLPDADFHFVRKGVIGSYNEEMPKEVIEQFDKWTLTEIEKNNMDPDIHRVFCDI
uniref:Sulfotransferase domain-containing protein n=1 Tax=Phlebotomus papatasi TaxID=29031 RepID=A0A1B0D0B6_PHLPP